jgi:hypothetical protein
VHILSDEIPCAAPSRQSGRAARGGRARESDVSPAGATPHLAPPGHLEPRHCARSRQIPPTPPRLLGQPHRREKEASDLDSALGTLLGPEETALNIALSLISPGLDISNLISGVNLETVLNNLTLGDGGTLGLTSLLTDLGIGTDTTALGTISELLGTLGITVPSTGDLSLSGLITDVLGELGKTVPSTGDLSLSTLLGDLGIDPNVGSLLDTVNLGTLLSDLGLSDTLLTGLPGILDLGDLSNLNLDGLLGDLGLGDLANITVDPFGGLITELVDTVPSQIIAAL